MRISNYSISQPLQNDIPAKTQVFPDVKCSEFISVLIYPGGFHAQSCRYFSYGQEFRRSSIPPMAYFPLSISQLFCAMPAPMRRPPLVASTASLEAAIDRIHDKGKHELCCCL